MIDTNPAPGEFTPGTQTRHVVTNHGFTFVLRETNDYSDEGMVDYSQAARRLPNQPGVRARCSRNEDPPARRR